MYEQGTYHYIQRELANVKDDGVEVWENVLFEDTADLWRSRSFGAAEREITRLRGVHGDDVRFRVVKRRFQEEIITPLYFHVDIDVNGTGDWQPVTHGEQGDAWRSRTYWRAFKKGGATLAATPATSASAIKITRTDDPSFVEILNWADFENQDFTQHSVNSYEDDEPDGDYVDDSDEKSDDES